jgi:hypothetical protein
MVSGSVERDEEKHVPVKRGMGTGFTLIGPLQV